MIKTDQGMDQKTGQERIKPDYQEGKIFELDRILDCNSHAILWLAAMKCSQVKYDTIGITAQLLETTTTRESDGKKVKELRIKDWAYRTNDLLYGVRFSVAIADLYIWFQSTSDTTSIAVVDFRGTDKFIKKVTFKDPIPLVNGYITLNVSYRYIETEFPDNFALDTAFFKETKALHPCYTFGVLADKERGDLIRSLIEDPGVADDDRILPDRYVPLSVVPSVHFKDGSIKCLGAVIVDVMSLIKQ